MEYAVADLTERERARIIKSAVTPRPIAWISTLGTDGVDNLAPFSSYNYVSSNRPLVTYHTPNEAAGGLKDTTRNAIDTGEFVVNVVTEDVLEAMDATAESIPTDESEFDHVGIERAECELIDAPRVADAAITMECTLYDAIEVRDRMMVLGDVVNFHVDESVLTDGKVDMAKLPTVGRLGGPYYTVSRLVEFERQF